MNAADCYKPSVLFFPTLQLYSSEKKSISSTLWACLSLQPETSIRLIRMTSPTAIFAVILLLKNSKNAAFFFFQISVIATSWTGQGFYFLWFPKAYTTTINSTPNVKCKFTVHHNKCTVRMNETPLGSWTQVWKADFTANVSSVCK